MDIQINQSTLSSTQTGCTYGMFFHPSVMNSQIKPYFACLLACSLFARSHEFYSTTSFFRSAYVHSYVRMFFPFFDLPVSVNPIFYRKRKKKEVCELQLC